MKREPSASCFDNTERAAGGGRRSRKAFSVLPYDVATRPDHSRDIALLLLHSVWAMMR